MWFYEVEVPKRDQVDEEEKKGNEEKRRERKHTFDQSKSITDHPTVLAGSVYPAAREEEG
jgi:hypothetical protein